MVETPNIYPLIILLLWFGLINASIKTYTQFVANGQQVKGAFYQLCSLFVPKNTVGLAALRLHYLCVHRAKYQATTTATVEPFQTYDRWKTKCAFCLWSCEYSSIKRHWCDAVPLVLGSVFHLLLLVLNGSVAFTVHSMFSLRETRKYKYRYFKSSYSHYSFSTQLIRPPCLAMKP